MRQYLKPMTKLIYGVAGMMMFVGLVESGTALAAEIKITTYPGTMCQPNNPTGAANIRYQSSGVYNQSNTQSLSVYCPIPYTLSGGDLSYVIVDVKDQSDEATISCTAHVRGNNGNHVHAESGNSDEFFGGNSDVFIPISYDGSGSTYNVRCSLPKRLGLNAFRVASYSAWERKE